MKTGRKLILSFALVAFCATTGYWLQASAAKGLGKGDKFPKINMQYLGKKKKLNGKALKGKVVIYDFWASWCTPCKVELPFLDKLYKKHRKEGLVVIGINVDEEQGSAQKFLKDHPVRFPIVFDKGKKLIDKAKVSTMPTSFIVDRQGVIRYHHQGFHKESMGKFRSQVKSLLKKK